MLDHSSILQRKITAVIGLSVPFTRRGKISSTKLWQKLYKNIFFIKIIFNMKIYLKKN